MSNLLKYEMFKNQIGQVIQNSELDPGVILLLLKDICEQVKNLYDQEVQKEYQKMQEQQKTKEEHENDLNKNMEDDLK